MSDPQGTDADKVHARLAQRLRETSHRARIEPPKGSRERCLQALQELERQAPMTRSKPSPRRWTRGLATAASIAGICWLALQHQSDPQTPHGAGSLAHGPSRQGPWLGDSAPSESVMDGEGAGNHRSLAPSGDEENLSRPLSTMEGTLWNEAHALRSDLTRASSWLLERLPFVNED